MANFCLWGRNAASALHHISHGPPPWQRRRQARMGKTSSLLTALGIISLQKISFLDIQASGGGCRGEAAGHTEAHKFFAESQGASGTMKHHLGEVFQRFLSLDLFCCRSCSFR